MQLCFWDKYWFANNFFDDYSNIFNNYTIFAAQFSTESK